MIKILGPCSAESFEQLEKTLLKLDRNDLFAFRAGVWKPRTSPGSFEGYGEEALKWLQKIKIKHDVKVATEVSNKEHIKLALQYDIDVLWIGARTSGNPFLMQEIAEELEGTDKTILVKNPLHPDLSLWLGGIERLQARNIKNVIGIFRGFYSYFPIKYRNEPIWKVLFDFKQKRPDLKIIVDPSHIAGDKNLIEEVCVASMSFDHDGFMIETHFNPNLAMSDASQQVEPKIALKILKNLPTSKNLNNDLLMIREQIDLVDNYLMNSIFKRNELIKKVKEIKEKNKLPIIDNNRFNDLLKERVSSAKELGIDESFVKDLFNLIHKNSIKRQNDD